MPIKSDTWYQYYLGLDNAAQLRDLLGKVHTEDPLELIYKYLKLRASHTYELEEEYRDRLAKVPFGSPLYDSLQDGLDYVKIVNHELGRMENFIQEVVGVNLMLEFGKKE